MTNNLYREAVWVAVHYGSTIERNRVTIYPFRSAHFTRYQVYTERHGQSFFETYHELDKAVDEFVNLCQ